MGSLLDLTALLQAAQSADAGVRGQAEATLKQLQESQHDSFLLSLSAELASADKPVDARRLAGLILKNTLDAKDEARKVRANALDHLACGPPPPPCVRSCWPPGSSGM